MAFVVQPWALFKASFVTFGSHQKPLLKMAALPILSVVLLGLSYFVAETGMIGAGGGLLVALVVLGLVYTSLSLYISWFRYMFRLEASPAWYRLDFVRHLRVFWAALKQLGFAGLPALVAFVVGAASGVAGGSENEDPDSLIILLIMALPVAWLVFAYTRLGLYLPAIALDEPVTLRKAFGETKGVFWRLFGLALMVSLLSLLSNVIDAGMSGFGASLPVLLIGLVIYALCLWLSLGVSLASSAEVYRAWLASKNGNEAKPDVAATSA
jgi:hypothetical protein